MSEDSENDEHLDCGYDSVENDPAYKAVIDSVMAEVMAELKEHPLMGKRGFCHVVWCVKKRILKEKHGIVWKSPREMSSVDFYD